jgi:hypothetical protein
MPEWGAGRWCDVFEIRDWKIQRCFIYLDPDYAGRDTARYPWLGKYQGWRAVLINTVKEEKKICVSRTRPPWFRVLPAAWAMR